MPHWLAKLSVCLFASLDGTPVVCGLRLGADARMYSVVFLVGRLSVMHGTLRAVFANCRDNLDFRTSRKCLFRGSICE